MLCAGQRYIKAPVAIEESDLVAIVGSHRRHYHERLFTTLPAIDCHYVVSDTEMFHLHFQMTDLALIRCDEAEFADVKLLHLLEVRKQSYHNLQFTWVEI